MSCGVGCRYGLDLVLLWLWYRPAAIVLNYAMGVALKRQKKKKKRKKKNFKKALRKMLLRLRNQTLIVKYFI